MFQLANFFIKAIEPVANSLQFFCACLILFLFTWSLFDAFIDALNKAKQMHQIPCTQCRFFTNNYRLKCTVNPYIANTKEAINCSDYQAD